MGVKLSTSGHSEAVPYFLWDEPMTYAQLEKRLTVASESERIRLLAKIMRQARDTDVWHYTTPSEVVLLWEKLSLMLGRRRAFWEFLLSQWRVLGLLDGK